MIRYELDKNKKIKYIEHNDVRGYNILCPRCFTEWRIDRGNLHSFEWVRNNLIGLTVDDGIRTPCGCYMSVWDILTTSILVDELIANPISRINKAGFKTKYSCSGHMHFPHGYVMFMHIYDDLLDWLTNDKYMLNILSVEVTIHDHKQNKNRTLGYTWNPEKSDWNYTGSMDHKDTLPLEHMTIRIKKPGNLYNLGTMLLFRRVLVKIAKWCEKTQAYNAENNFRKKFLSKLK